MNTELNKYTVVIPVRDGGETLGATLQTCLRQTYPNFEIIVSDNCSSDNTKRVVDYFQDPRIRYINPGHRVSMSGNFEFALRHVTDGFVMFIGSDDGIMPDAIEYVNDIVDRYKVLAASCRQATYVWPNFPDEKIAGRFVFGGWRNDVEIRYSKEWISRTLNFQLNYCFDLPNLYCGFVHTSVLAKAYKDGSYFKSITPDAYSAFATALFTETYAFSHRAFSIAGASAKSNGASAMNPASSKEEVVKFYSENDIKFFTGFINCPSYEVIVAEAFAQLANAFPVECNEYKINYNAMLDSALKNLNMKTAEDVKDAVSKMAVNFRDELGNNNVLVKKNLLHGKTFSDAWRAFFSLFSASRVAEISKSETLGITNIYDAALIAYAFERNRSNPNTSISNKKYIINLLKQTMGYR